MGSLEESISVGLRVRSGEPGQHRLPAPPWPGTRTNERWAGQLAHTH